MNIENVIHPRHEGTNPKKCPACREFFWLQDNKAILGTDGKWYCSRVCIEFSK